MKMDKKLSRSVRGRNLVTERVWPQVLCDKRAESLAMGIHTSSVNYEVTVKAICSCTCLNGFDTVSHFM